MNRCPQCGDAILGLACDHYSDCVTLKGISPRPDAETVSRPPPGDHPKSTTANLRGGLPSTESQGGK